MSGNNEEWKRYGGVSKVNSFNVINTSALIADQFVSRSSRPSEQFFNGSLEVTADLKAGNSVIAGNNITAGNSISSVADIYINQNAYINHKLFFFSKSPTLDNSMVDLSSTLVIDTSHAFITGDVSNIGVNIVHPKTIFHISCDVSNVSDILTVESSNGTIRSIMSQTKDKKGIVFDASNETSNISFFNGGIDISTNKLNTPTANIRHSSGGFLSLRTGDTIDISSGTFFVDSSGVNLKLDSSGVVLESSGSILFDTSSNFQIDSSRGFFIMDSSTGSISMGASGEFRVLSSVSDDNVGGIFILNKKEALLSTSGEVLINSSGGLIKLDATNKGEVIFNSGSFNLNTTLNFAPPDTDISATTMYRETITIYDNSASHFFPNIFNHDLSAITTSTAMVARSLDPSNNTNIKLVSAKSGKGAHITGGVYPDGSYNKNMAMFGLTDLSNGFTPNHMILSGTEKHNKLSTLGINTFKPSINQYVLDVNGPMHINNVEINTVTESLFEYQSMSFSKINSLTGIACGAPSNSISPNYTQFLVHTNDGGKNWLLSNIYEQENENEPEESTETTNIIDFKQSFIMDGSYGFIAGNGSKIYFTKNGGVDWKNIQFSDLGTFTTNALTGSLRSIDDTLVYRFIFSYLDSNDQTANKIRMIDLSASTIETKLVFTDPLLTVGDVAGVDIESKTVSTFGRVPFVTSMDTSGQYLYLVGETGIDRLDISTNVTNFVSGGNYPRTITSSDVGAGISALKYNHVFAHSDTHVIAVGDNLISVTTDGENWTDGSLNMINNIGDVSLNKSIIIDVSNALIVGNRGVFLHSNNWSDVHSWNYISENDINPGGTQNLIQDICNNLVGINMPEPGNYLIASNTVPFVNQTTDVSGTPGTSKMQYFTSPAMFHSSVNDVLELSGNIVATGNLVLHNGNIVADNISSAVNGSLTLGGTSDFLNIGECSAPENMFRNVGSQSIGTKDLSAGYKVINIGANTASNLNDISPYVINIGNHEPYTESAQYKGNKIFIGGGDDIVVIDGSGVEFKSQSELTVNSTHITLNFTEGDSPNTGTSCGFKIKSDGDNRAGFIESSADRTGYVLKAPSGVQAQSQNILKIDTSNSILYPGVTTGLMVLKETAISDGSFVMQSANLDLSNILIRNPTFEAPHGQYTEDVMQRITSGLLIEGDLSCNNRLFIEKDVNIRGQLTVEQYQNENIITTTTNNYTFLTVAEDMSLNGRLFVRDDVSLNGSVYIDNSLGIATHNPVVAFDVSTVDAIKIPRGSTADRPITSSYVERGYLRYNTDSSQFEGYGPGNAWVSLGGAVDVDQDTFISAERGAGNDNDQLHFFTASGDTINVPHLRAVIDGSGLTIGSQLCEDVSNNTLTSTDPGFPGPRPPENGLWVQGDASFNTLLRAQDMSVNMLQVKDASINNLGVTDLSVNDISANLLLANDSSINVLNVSVIQSSDQVNRLMNFGNSKVPYSSLDGVPADSTNIESVPVGGIIMWGGSSIPIGFYICDGGQQSVSNTLPVSSFAAPGVGTINIPDLRNKFVLGADTEPGSTPNYSGTNPLGSTGGSFTILEANLPSHTHNGNTNDGGSYQLGELTGTISSDTGHTHALSGAATGQAYHFNTGSSTDNTAIFTANIGNVDNNLGLSGGGAHSHRQSAKQPDDLHYTGGSSNNIVVGADNGNDEQFTSSYTESVSNHNHSINGNIAVNAGTVDIREHVHAITGSVDSGGGHSHTLEMDAVAAHTHPFTTNPTGSGTAYYQPYYTLVFIIRFTTPLDGGNQVFGKELYYVPRMLAIGPTQAANLSIDMRDASDGIVFPRGTTAQRPNFSDLNIYPELAVNGVYSSAKVLGTMRYNSTTNKFEGYTGAAGSEKWGSIGGGVMDQDEDTFIRANGATDEDTDQLHFFTASGDVESVPCLRAVMDGSGFTIGSQLSADVSNNILTSVDSGFPGPLPPENGLWVQGDVSFNSNASIGNSVIIGGSITHDANYKLYVNGDMQATSYNALSDERWKQQIYTLSGALETVNQLRGVSYYWKNRDINGKEKNQYGLIAQEVEKILPTTITTCSGESSAGIYEQKSLNYLAMIPWLVEAVKELTQENTELKQKVSSLEETVTQIKTHLNL